MDFQGGCYCGELRYEAKGNPAFKGACYCRECQFYTGGAQNLVIGLPEAGFSWTKGSPSAFRRSDLDSPVTREFCGACGTQIVSKAPGLPGVVLVKVGTLDDPAAFGAPQMAIFTCDKQAYHQLPDGVPAFDRTPG